MIEHDPYSIADPDAIETPAMVVFEAQVNANIAALCELVGGGANLMAHVKTHKSEAIVRKQLAAGICGFKCATLRELEMVLDAGAPEAILAYPMLQQLKVNRCAQITDAHPAARVYATAGDTSHVEALAAAAGRRHAPHPGQRPGLKPIKKAPDRRLFRGRGRKRVQASPSTAASSTSSLS